MRVARILAQPLGEIGDLLGQRRDLSQQSHDLRLKLDVPRVPRRDLCVLRAEGDLELGDPLLRVQRPT